MARIFVYDGREYPDIDPTMSPQEVANTMSDMFHEIATAEIKTTKRGEDTIYEFVRKVGTKG